LVWTILPTIGDLCHITVVWNYPEIQAVFDQYRQAVSPQLRKDLIERVQTMIYEKKMFIPLTGSGAPTALGPRVKGNPLKIPPLLWFSTPFEDIELAN
jgi:ABC-type transport system substrate-binding protein